MMMKFPIAIETGDETTAWGVVVPDLPGCFSAGDTPDEAYTMAKEAIGLWINTALDSGQAIPKPKTLADRIKDPEYAGWTWGVVEVNLKDFDEAVERINITVPKRILRQIDDYVAVRHENRSGFLTRAALEAIYEHA